MQKDRANPVIRPIIRQSYDFGRESVHFATDPDPSGPLPTHECGRCRRTLPQDQFGPIGPYKRTTSRVSRQRYLQALHPHCFKCRRQENGTHAGHPLYSPGIDNFFDRLVWGATSGARSRGILFGIDKDDVLGMYLAQNGLCALTGLKLDWETPGRQGRNGRNYKAPSIDRIDSAGNYVLGNVQIVMQIVNVMKNDLPQDQFVGLCRRIADHNLSL